MPISHQLREKNDLPIVPTFKCGFAREYLAKPAEEILPKTSGFFCRVRPVKKDLRRREESMAKVVDKVVN